MKATLCTTVLLIVAATVSGQDQVIYRDRASANPKAAHAAKGRIESESVAGVKVEGRMIAASDVVDVKYEAPGQVSYDLSKALTAEAARKYDEAIREYRSLIANSSAPNWSALRRQFEYKIALIIVAKADASGDGKPAIEAIEDFVKQFPDCWQRVPLTRQLVRLRLDQSPPDLAGAMKAIDSVSALASAPPDLKADLALSAVDVALGQKNWEEARKRLGAVPADDPRRALYQIACSAETSAIDRLTAAAESGEERLRPTAYNLLGDICRADPKRQKDALFAYLWVDVVYDFDPRETAKAREQLARLFKEQRDNERAQKYRAKSRGQ